MKKDKLKKITKFVNENIVQFHNNKLKVLKALNLKSVLSKKNPYLFRAKNVTIASEFITNILDAYLSSSEEKIFGDFLEEVTLFVAGMSYKAQKSSSPGIDLEFIKDRKIYLVSVKSGPNWGNSGQQRKQVDDFNKAERVLRQSKQVVGVEPILGICYGKAKRSHLNGYSKLVGQEFWYLMSGSKTFYTDIIEPLGYKAKEHNGLFNQEKAQIYNLFTRQFLTEFCSKGGQIDWIKLVEFNSGNLEG